MARDLPRVDPRSNDKIRREALKLAHRISPQALEGKAAVATLEYCENALEDDFGVGFRVIERARMRAEGEFDGFELTIREDVYHDYERGRGRPRFTLAHELGHVVLHRSIMQSMNLKPRGSVALFRTTDPIYQNPEWQANRFGAELVAPLPGISALLQRTGPLKRWQLVFELMAIFKISEEAARIRVDDLITRGNLGLSKEKVACVTRLFAG